MEGHDKPWNLDNFAAVNRGIWQNLPQKTVGPNDEAGLLKPEYN